VFGLSRRAMILIGGGAVVLALAFSNNKQPQDAAAADAATADPTQCRVTVTADVLNVRAAPALDAPIVGKFLKNAETNADKVVENGFRKIANDRWAASEFLTPKEGHDCGSA
jgi:hypothetical protein